MALIRVEGYEMDTKDIVNIKEAGYRRCGFKIILVGPKVITIDEEEPYDMIYSNIARINDKYRKLREAIEKKWEEDKSEVETFNL